VAVRVFAEAVAAAVFVLAVVVVVALAAVELGVAVDPEALLTATADDGELE
jgi:hypothetical protein